MIYHLEFKCLHISNSRSILLLNLGLSLNNSLSIKHPLSIFDSIISEYVIHLWSAAIKVRFSWPPLSCKWSNAWVNWGNNSFKLRAISNNSCVNAATYAGGVKTKVNSTPGIVLCKGKDTNTWGLGGLVNPHDSLIKGCIKKSVTRTLNLPCENKHTNGCSTYWANLLRNKI